MTGQINIPSGPPAALWNSDSIRLRNSLENNPLSCGPHVAPKSGSNRYTYVKVSNIGTSAIGACSGTLLGAWKPAIELSKTPPTAFPDYAPGGGSRMESTSVGGEQYVKLIDSNNNQAGVWPAEFVTGLPTFWGWSPNGSFCAVVISKLKDSFPVVEMTISLIAVKQYTRVDGFVVPAGTEIKSITWDTSRDNTSSINDVFQFASVAWNESSTAVVAQLANASAVTYFFVLPYVEHNPTSSPLLCRHTPPVTPYDSRRYTYLFSPNGDVSAAYLNPMPGYVYGDLLFFPLKDSKSLTYPATGYFKPTQNGSFIEVRPNSASPVTINSAKTGLNGVLIGGAEVRPIGGLGLPLASVMDNPECLVGQSADVFVRRNRISTIPNQTDYEKIGVSKVAIPPGGHAWVEFPSLLWVNPTGAQNPGQLHYCIQAMGEAPPGDLAPGSLPNAPSWTGFNLSDRHFAQRNIAFV